jgi:hypothetical protein
MVEKGLVRCGAIDLARGAVARLRYKSIARIRSKHKLVTLLQLNSLWYFNLWILCVAYYDVDYTTYSIRYEASRTSVCAPVTQEARKHI